ncbi:GFA family protein [Ovoidimarina sediminis]|uniref:GFA family protein n=1 Tax=Ovoidimarina sediminis TaxID=3079856 RepID=UPI002911B826|nr:GFA family protein [Rhodophyticola sp. MJ-SS7]MDU8944568.1 GFA family protein [Rhodophyticola sp. MJ-SS7]
MSRPDRVSGRCYCGSVSVSADTAPRTVAYCHCADCRRLTGAPVAAFAAFLKGALRLAPEPAPAQQVTKGVKRCFCPDYGSPLAATFDYLPGQVYVPLGLLDQADDLQPDEHCHDAARLSWLHIADDRPRSQGSARGRLGTTKRTPETCG